MEKYILPKQYVSKYVNDEGITLFPTLFVNIENLEIEKIYIEKNAYKNLEIKKMQGHYVNLELGEDENGHTTIVSIKIID